MKFYEKNLLLATAILAAGSGLSINAHATEGVVFGDAYVSQAKPNKNFGSTMDLHVGNGDRTYIKIDLSTLPPGTTSAQIGHASIVLWVNNVGTAGLIEVSPVTTAWDENLINATTAPSAGAAIAAVQVDPTLVNQYVIIDITSIVKTWVDYPNQNFGVVFAPSILVPGAVVAFNSKEAPNDHAGILDITLIGPAGPAGAVGSIGPVGPAGAVGAIGPVGPAGAGGALGAIGPAGAVGALGPVGPAGAVGAIGPVGPAGAVGAIGPVGPAGAVGALGPVGPAGAVGALGPIGPVGAVGALGPVGPAGAVGALGPVGPAGAVGALGPVGPAGAVGPVGPAGPVGALGPVGPAGAVGALGPVGPAGAVGTVGPVGPAGAVGAVGPVGPAGAVGAVGPVGATGATGATGIGLQGVPGQKGDKGDQGIQGVPGVMGDPRIVQDTGGLITRYFSVMSFIRPPGGYAVGQEYAPRYYHIKTPLVNRSGAIWRYDLKGYAYGIAKSLDFTWVGYFYAADINGNIYQSSCLDVARNNIPCSQYKGTDGFLYLKFGPISQYENTFTLDYQNAKLGYSPEYIPGVYTVTVKADSGNL